MPPLPTYTLVVLLFLMGLLGFISGHNQEY